MTVNTISSVAEFDTNGVTTNYPFYFKFLANEDLVVTYVDPLGVSSTLTLGTHYSVNGAGNDQGGSIVTTSALAGPGQLVVSREMEAFQQTSLRNQGKFLAETHEDVFDKLTMLIQQGFAGIGRALKRPVGKAYFDAEGRLISNVADPVADQDAATKGWIVRALEAASGTLVSVNNIYYDGITLYQYLKSGVARNVDNLSALRALDSTRNQRAFVRDNSAVGDRFGAMWWVNTADTTSAEDLTKGIVVGADGARWYFSGPGAMSLGQQGLSALNDNGWIWGYRSTTSPAQGNGNKFNFFKLEIANDNVSQVAGQNDATGSKVNGFHVFHNFGGSLAKGGRHAGDFVLIQGFGGGGITSSTNGDRNYVGIQGQVLTDTGDGGTSAVDVRGAYFGGSAFAGALGGNRIANLTGFEFNTEITAGPGTRVAIHTGLQVASKIGERGYGIDSAISVSNLGGSTRGWQYGVCFHGSNGAPAFEADSTVLKIFPAASASAAIDKVIDTVGVTVNSLISANGVNLRSGVLDMNAPNSQVSIGANSASAPRFQIKSSGLNSTYDSAITGSGGSAATGDGIMTFQAGNGIIANTALFRPQTDNYTQFGNATYRISQITLATAPVVTSDLNEKDNIKPLSVGLDFIKAIEPIEYTCRESGTGEVKQVLVRVDRIEVPDTEEYEEETTEISVVDGKAIRTFSTVTKTRQIMDSYPEFDADGNRVMVKVKVPSGTYIDEETGDKKLKFTEEMQESFVRVGRVKTIDVPVYEPEVIMAEGRRVHFGLGAQQVKEAMTSVGIQDFAGWVLADKDDPNSRQGLRYEQFIAVLIKGVKELADRVDSLENKNKLGD